MGDKTGIEWADATWNPTTGCDKVSPGCDHCYALTQAKRLQAMGSAHYQTDGDPATSGPGFGFAMHPDALDKPLRWTRPRKIFVNSMSDLFHGRMDVEFLAQVWAVMSIAEQHTFQILTKRPQIMRSVLTRNVEVHGASMPFKMLVDVERLRRGYPVLPDSRRDDGTYAWPLRNVWLGTSVEDQKRADLRMPHLAATPAAVRFVSAEPLLGPVDLSPWLPQETNPMSGGVLGLLTSGGRCDMQPTDNAFATRHVTAECRQCTNGKRISWVIVGGESGKDARPMHPGFARDLRDQCAAGGVAFLFKQWGSWAPVPVGQEQTGDRYVLGNGAVHDVPWHPEQVGAEPGHWHKHGDVLMREQNKHATGRTLDGRTHDEYPVLHNDGSIETVTASA